MRYPIDIPVLTEDNNATCLSMLREESRKKSPSDTIVFDCTHNYVSGNRVKCRKNSRLDSRADRVWAGSRSGFCRKCPHIDLHEPEEPEHGNTDNIDESVRELLK